MILNILKEVPFAFRVCSQVTRKYTLGRRSPVEKPFGHYKSGTRFAVTASSSQTQQAKYKRVSVEETEAIRELFSSEGFKPKKSPTRFYISKISLPENFFEYAKRVLQHENIKRLEDEAEILFAHLRHRQPPIEDDEFRHKTEIIEHAIREKDSILEPFLSEKQLEVLEKARANKIAKELKRTVYHWEPIKYTYSKALQYLIARTPAEYAALSRVFNEILQRDPSFKPETLLDFGSGIGSVLWAAQRVWSSSLIEHMCIDASREMNGIADLLTRKGLSKRDPIFPGIYFRQFLPYGAERKYDVTVSSFSLLELPSAKSRMEILDVLWKSTKKYLVIVESGSNAGFEVLNEARDFILQVHRQTKSRTYENQTGQQGLTAGHAFAPCPHDSICPRYATDTTPCNFHVHFRPLLPFHKDITQSEVYSYVVLKKGVRSKQEEPWPRLIRDPLLRGRHVICRLCTKNGLLEEAVLTKGKHFRPLYAYARKSRCGDFLPVQETQLTPTTDDALDESESDDDDDGEVDKKEKME